MMNREEIEQKVKEILADILDIDAKKIELNSDLVNDFGMDSFGAIEVVFALKEQFKIDIPEEDLKNIKLVSEIVEYIKSHL